MVKRIEQCLLGLFVTVLVVCSLFIIYHYFKEEVVGCCDCGTTVNTCCPCQNYETIDYFKDNCKKYYPPSSAGSWYDVCSKCNKELNLSLSCWRK
jgi:hypothetical protein